MSTIAYQAHLRPALPEIDGPKEYHQERELLIRLDEILVSSGLEQEFIALAMAQRGFDPAEHSPKRIDTVARYSVLALRSNIVRQLKGMEHREFCTRLADSALLQWFLQIGRIDKVKVFAKSTSDRFAHWIDEAGLHDINVKLTELLATDSAESTDSEPAAPDLQLLNPVSFDDIYFDSTCLKAPIHFPVDWVLLRDASRTLMKATQLIRRSGLRPPYAARSTRLLE